jgi:hypothetical protein
MTAVTHSAMLIAFQSHGVGAEERQAETVMINLAEMEIRRADYAARVERFNREGWMRAAAVPTAGGRTRRMPSTVGLMRRRVGDALIGVGERLRGTPAGHAADPAAAAHYTLDAVR